MMRKKTLGLLMLAVLLAVAPAMAVVDDGRTFQCWDFGQETSQFGILPSLDQNPYGTSAMLISDLSAYQQGVEWRNGAWYGSEFKIIIDVPNQQVNNPYKLLWIELKYQGDVDFVWVADAVSGNHFELISSEEPAAADTNGWKTLLQTWRFEPNPREEIIVIGLKGIDGGLAAIDGICVTTWCVPEPATLAIFGIGAMMAFRRRK